MKLDDVIVEHAEWLDTKGPPSSGHLLSMLKLQEEIGELAAALYRGKEADARDAVGDVAITLMSLCHRMGWYFKGCVSDAWSQVRNRDYIKYPGRGRP